MDVFRFEVIMFSDEEEEMVICKLKEVVEFIFLVYEVFSVVFFRVVECDMGNNLGG